MSTSREIVASKGSAGTVVDIPIGQILPDPHQPRKKIRRINELATSIQNQGLQQFPMVNFAYRKGNKDYYFIKAGERRWRAHQKLGRATMRCVVESGRYGGLRDLRRRLAQAAENSSREPHTHGEIIELVEEVVKEEIAKKGSSYGAIETALSCVADAFGLSSAWANNYHTLAGLLPELREMLDDDDEGERLNFSVGIALARAPTDTQLKILREAKPKFKKGGHAAGYGYIVRRVRQIREDRGEKMRGRASDDKMQLVKVVRRLLLLGSSLSGERRSGEYKKHVEGIVDRMTTLEVDSMLNELKLGIQSFLSLRELLEVGRNRRYAPLRAVK